MDRFIPIAIAAQKTTRALDRNARRAISRDTVLICAALGILVLAGATYVWMNAGDVAPSDQFVDMRCSKCKADFKLSYKQFDRMMERGEYKTLPSRFMVFKCPKCNEFTASRQETPEAPAPSTGP